MDKDKKNCDIALSLPLKDVSTAAYSPGGGTKLESKGSHSVALKREFEFFIPL